MNILIKNCKIIDGINDYKNVYDIFVVKDKIEKVKEEESLSLIIQARNFFLSWNRMPKRDSLTRKLLMP